MMLVSDLISRARILLNDTDAANYRWANTELISWINDGQLLISVHRPDATGDWFDLTLGAGAYQEISVSGQEIFRLMDIVANVDSSGNLGRAVTPVDRATLDAFDASWRSGTRQSTVKHFIFDDRFPLAFETYPPAVAGTKVRGKCAIPPAAVTATTDALTIPTAYFEPLFSYVMFRAYSKDLEFSANSELASKYLAAFNGSMGLKLQKDNAFSPKVNRRGDTPNVTAMKLGGV